MKQPVYLFDLAFVEAMRMQSIEPHVCDKDLYTAQLVIMDKHLNIDWSVIGPSKNDTIEYESSSIK